MTKRSGLTFRSRACQRCGDSVYLEIAGEDEWRCLQCARPVAAPAASAPAVARPVKAA